ELRDGRLMTRGYAEIAATPLSGTPSSEHTSAAWATKARREPTRIVEAANAAAHDHYRNHPADALRELGLTG
ncbi:hypothetical protein, partial [Streptomyces turgidiscabies]|uniref:hypothetical protein n=1 Tax=Streptomyces turgidiscabies TaxID=85558 RepID=UPI0038F67B25